MKQWQPQWRKRNSWLWLTRAIGEHARAHNVRQVTISQRAFKKLVGLEYLTKMTEIGYLGLRIFRGSK